MNKHPSLYLLGYRWCGWCADKWRRPNPENRCPECGNLFRVKPKKKRERFVQREG